MSVLASVPRPGAEVAALSTDLQPRTTTTASTSPVKDDNVQRLMKTVQRMESREVERPAASPPTLPPTALAGERAEQPHPTLPPKATSSAPPSGASGSAELERAVHAAEAEVRALGSEVDSVEKDARHLHDLVRDADRRLLRKAEQVAEMSTKASFVQADTAQQTLDIKEAAERRVAGQLSSLRRHLVRQEEELARKQEEIDLRRRSIEEARALCEEQRNQVVSLHRGIQEMDASMASKLDAFITDAKDQEKKQGVDAWLADMKAGIERSRAGAASARAWREELQTLHSVQEEIDTLRPFIERFEAKNEASRAEIARRERRFEALRHQESLVSVAERLGLDKAARTNENLAQESRELEERIAREKERRRAGGAGAEAYERASAESSVLHGQLQELTMCMREALDLLRDGDASAHDGNAAVDDAMVEFLRELEQRGGHQPSVMRAGPALYEVDGELVTCALSEGRRLCVRSEGGGLLFFGDYLHARASQDGGLLPRVPETRSSLAVRH